MSSWNVYYDPAACGLAQIGVLDEADLSWEFNTLVAWRDNKTGRVFYAQDSGCSCPTPFEDYHFNGADDTNLDEITPQNIENFQRAVANFPAPQDERGMFIDAVRDALRKAAR